MAIRVPDIQQANPADGDSVLGTKGGAVRNLRVGGDNGIDHGLRNDLTTTGPGKGAELVAYEGGSVAGAISSQSTEIEAIAQAAVAGHIGFATKALMDADTSRPTGTLALVTNDSTASNNATYRWNGSAWVLSSDRVTQVQAQVVESGLQQDDAKFILPFHQNQISPGHYEPGSTDAFDAGAVGTLLEKIAVDGKPAIRMTARLSDGAGILRKEFANLAFMPSGTLSFGAEIVSSEASTVISRLRVIWYSGAPGSGTLRTDNFDVAFSGITSPRWFVVNPSAPVGAASVRCEVLAYGDSTNRERVTVISKVMVCNGKVSVFMPSAATSSVGTGVRSIYLATGGHDLNAGTRSSPKKTLAAAITALAGVGEVVVLPGDYGIADFQFNYTDVKNLHIVGEVRNLPDKAPLIRGGFKLQGIALESGKVYKASVSGLGTTTQPNWIWLDGTPEAGTLVPASERHGLLRGRSYRLPSTRIRRTAATTLAAAITEIQGDAEPKCFLDASTTTIYFSIPGGGDATGADIYVGASNADKGVWGQAPTSDAAQIATSGVLRASNLDFRYVSVNTRPFVWWKISNVSVLAGRTSSFHYAGAGELVNCEAMGCDGGGGGGGDGFNAHDWCAAELRSCYTHDHNDDGESCHVNCNVVAYGCISEYNGSAGFIPASGGHGIYFNCTARNNNLNGGSNAGFETTGVPLDEGVDTSADCHNCVSINDFYGFCSRTGAQLRATDCKAVNPSDTGYIGAGTTLRDCQHSGGGTPAGAGVTVTNTVAVVAP